MGRSRVLVVDDKEDVANAFAAVLQINGYDAAVETDGRAALARAVATRPDAVLLDLGLPGMSGHDICRHIRNEPGWGTEVLVVAITGWARESDRLSARAAGFDHYLLKPVEFETVDALLRAAARRGGAATLGAATASARRCACACGG